ncbi:MAG: putative HTH-type transcriptional regulator [Planctomycetes bacterium ADurb.Bin126]|nr:MAG: putative HTH-type transcriptional regulator [Planctomycetes bacterium ADurb.Bin126]HOD81900.1 metalloregulator ArsR/SmtB family transcription factor [Phycisphaerae bacterium]HQL74613.1 metalloregulator ArsR/SmtB family transcription factor [Phycisphaerae bacterium]
MDKNAKRLYELKAQVLQALAHPIRLAVVDFLADGEQCVCDIAAHIGCGRPNLSRHLALMLQAGVLDCRKDGLRMLYRLKTPCVSGFLSCVSGVLRGRAKEHAAVLEAL